MQTNIHIKPYGPRPGLGRAEATVKLSFLRSEFYATAFPSQPAIQNFKELGRCNLRFPTFASEAQAYRSKESIRHQAYRAEGAQPKRAAIALSAKADIAA